MKRAKERTRRCVGLSVVDVLVRAIIQGDKLETRRPLHRSPNVRAGDELYVRECWAPMHGREDTLTLAEYEGGQDPAAIVYRSDERPPNPAKNDLGVKYLVRQWYPAIHMPKWAARIFLPLVEVRTEPLRNISGASAIREGVLADQDNVDEYVERNAVSGLVMHDRLALDVFIDAWDSIYGKTDNSWSKNPIVRVYRWEKARILC